jgi:integrase
VNGLGNIAHVRQLDVDTHALRHSYTSALISGGACVKVVQMRLRHGSAVVTLDTYGHLWPDDDHLARTAMDAALGTLEYQLSTEAVAEG